MLRRNYNMKSPIYLINVSGNHYKFYDMHDNGNGTFNVVYGRIGSTRTEHTYPISKWNNIYRQKTGRKGYTDVSSNIIEPGSAVKTLEDKMGIVVGPRGEGTTELVVEMESKAMVVCTVGEITPTGIDLGGALHKLFYPHLCEVHSQIKDGTYKFGKLHRY